MSRTLFPLAGFQVILIGRFWVIAEAILSKLQIPSDGGIVVVSGDSQPGTKRVESWNKQSGFAVG